MTTDARPHPLPPVTIPDTRAHALRSTHVDDEYEIWIAAPRPAFVPGPPAPRRVLYVLDANLFFGTATETTRLMHMLYRELPPLHVVGIAYPNADPVVQSLLRTRDFTPSHDPGIERMMASMPGPRPPSPLARPMGGAPAFLRCLVDEVQPLVADAIGGEPDEAILFGSSLGGLFAVHTYRQRPRAFDAVLAVSPALWWNDGEAFRSAFPSAHGESPNLYLAVGQLEESPGVPALAPYRMVSNTHRLAHQLAEAGARVHVEELAGETHTSVVPVALLHGLRRLLRGDPGSNTTPESA